MILSRAKTAARQDGGSAGSKKKEIELTEYIEKRDYSAALASLLFQRQTPKNDETTDLWIGYCYFHLGDYKKAMQEYEKMIHTGKHPDETRTYLACCQFFLGMYDEANEMGQKGPKTALQNRLLFHVAHKLSDEKQLMYHHQQLQNILEDQLCLASIHYMRSHYQEAIDIYKRILLNNRNFIALNVYLALCYFKLDYYDVSLEVLQIYLQQHADSVSAINLKACNHYKLYNGKAAEQELKSLTAGCSNTIRYAQDIVQHNVVVFRNGEGALQVLPPLVGVLPEARLNLVIYYIQHDDDQEAFELVKDLKPTIPQEYIISAIVHCIVGQNTGTREHLKTAQQYFQLVGGSAAECDTIPGRQCMASCYFLLKQFEEVLVYLNSIKSYFYNDDFFNYDMGQVLAALGRFTEAEEALGLVQSEKLKRDYVYISTICRCYVINKKGRLAWDLYMKMDTSAESFSLLQLIANDCYTMGQFYYAFKAFDVLERLDANPEYWEGKRGAAVGVLQLVIAGKEPPESLRDVVQVLEDSAHPQAHQIVLVIRKWAKDNKVLV